LFYFWFWELCGLFFTFTVHFSLLPSAFRSLLHISFVKIFFYPHFHSFYTCQIVCITLWERVSSDDQRGNVLTLLFRKNVQLNHSKINSFYFLEIRKAGNLRVACFVFRG